MRIKTIVAGAAIALAATIGTASADEQFSILEGIAAEAMAPRAMGEVTGAAPLLTVTPPSGPMRDIAHNPAADVITTFPNLPAEGFTDVVEFHRQ